MNDVIPILLDADGNAVHLEYMKMAQAYYKQEFGIEMPKLNPADRHWIVVSKKEGGVAVTGYGRMSQIIDIPTFHVSDERSNLLLFHRMNSWAIDSGLSGRLAQVYIEQSQEPKWKKFLHRIKAVRAGRWLFTIQSSLENENGSHNTT